MRAKGKVKSENCKQKMSKASRGRAPKRGAAAPTQLGQLAGNPDNPRKITPEAVAALRVSLETFGDLSGVVWNAATGHLVCAHQRKAALEGVDLSEIEWGPEQVVELGAAGKRFKSPERWGAFRLPGGAGGHRGDAAADPK
ncbi:MAG TPA: hypothetical protein VM487_18275 [Phycisphaerae bacterium]|nr:hypothetical protein [Phycisphaerae bacterium]